MGLFGKTNTSGPKEQVNEWTRKLRKERYQLDRQIRGIQREQDKVKRSLKDAAKNNNKDACVVLAKEMIRSRKAVTRIHTAKAQINSVEMHMKEQLGQMRMLQTLKQSTDVMRLMQQLVRVPELAASMQEMSREMMKAGIMEEMMEDAMEVMEDSEEMEEEAQKEVDKVLWEVTEGELGRAPSAPTASVSGPEAEAVGGDADEESDPEELEQMQQRLQALRS